MNTTENKLSAYYFSIRSRSAQGLLFLLVYGLLIAATYCVIIVIPEQIFGYQLSFAATNYILLSVSSIVLTTWGEKISGFVLRAFPKRYIHSRQMHLIDERKIRFVLIFIYFVAIIVFTLASLIEAHVFSVEKMDYSVIQSFATYISYDRLIRNYPTIGSKNKDKKSVLDTDDFVR